MKQETQDMLAIFDKYENTDAELIAFDVLGGNIIAYRADFNSFSEIVLDDGRVIRQIEQPGGGMTYSIVENVGIDGVDAFMAKAGGEWHELVDLDELETLITWIAAIEK